MSDKGPSGWCSVGPRHEAGVRRSTARPVLVALPVDPAGPSDPDGFVTQPPPPPPGKAVRWWCRSSSPTDPALPGGSAWEKFYAVRGQCHKGFRGSISRFFFFPKVVHNTPGFVHTEPPDVHRIRRPLLTSGPDQSER